MSYHKICEICSKEYLSTHHDAMYCTQKCRNAARYIKRAGKFREKSIRKYGITSQIYEQMLEEQDFVCKICKKDEVVVNINTGYPYPLSIDHCHETGQVRGLLCRHCNLVLGQVEKRPEIIKECLKYLKKVKGIK